MMKHRNRYYPDPHPIIRCLQHGKLQLKPQSKIHYPYIEAHETVKDLIARKRRAEPGLIPLINSYMRNRVNHLF